MSNKNTAFYRGKQAILFDFSADEISNDGAVLLLEKTERKHKFISKFSQCIPDKRHPLRISLPMYKLLKQKAFSLMLGYEDANDVQYLKYDPLLKVGATIKTSKRRIYYKFSKAFVNQDLLRELIIQ